MELVDEKRKGVVNGYPFEVACTYIYLQANTERFEIIKLFNSVGSSDLKKLLEEMASKGANVKLKCNKIESLQ